MKLRTLSAAAALILTAPLLAGCITINVPAAESDGSSRSGSEGGSEATTDTGIDDSAAIAALQIATGALFKYVETYAPEDCSFVGLIGQQLDDATPLDSYRGSYETIVTNMSTVYAICINDPANVDAVDLAARAHQKVGELLAELGSPLGNPPAPVRGNQAG